VAAFRVNGGGTLNVLEAARALGIRRVVYASAKGVYGVVPAPHGHPDYVPINEDYPKNPVNVYDATKLHGEHLGENYAKNYGLEFVSLRFSTTFGPGKLARHGPLSIHCKLVENAMLGRPTVVPKGAEQGDDMVYFPDVAQGIVKALFAEKLGRRVYNIGTSRAWTIVDFARAIQKRFPGAAIEIGPGLDYMNVGAYYSVFDCSRAKKDLGYEPKFDLQAGVADYVETMERLGLEPAYTP
jgi:UDP-glucose 4-epimerase